MMAGRLAFGLIGAGLIGRLHAQHLASRIPAAKLVAVCDIEASAVAECLTQCEFEAVYEDYRRMLTRADIDAVAICTPPETHGEIIEVAAAAGKHIFCEKPIDVDLARTDRAVAATKRAGVKLQIGFNRRFDRNFRRVKDELSSGAIGQPRIVHIVSRDPVRTAAEGGESPADLFLDTTIHDLDMARFLIGDEITSIHALGKRYSNAGPDPDTAVTLLRFAGGCIATIDNSRHSVYGYDQRLEVFGSGGMLAVGNEAPDPSPAPNAQPFFVQRYGESYLAELVAFVQSILDDTEPSVTGADGRIALALALAAQRSYRQGRPVEINERD